MMYGKIGKKMGKNMTGMKKDMGKGSTAKMSAAKTKMGGAKKPKKSKSMYA